MKIQDLRNTLQERRGEKLKVERSLANLRADLLEEKRSLRRYEQAREIIREVGLKTQQQLQLNISDITSLALEAVFDNPYTLVVEFVLRRNKTECDLYFMRDGNKVDPLDAAGLGSADVAAFALRIAAWSMNEPKTDNTLILDEPFKHLKGAKENKQVLEMIRKISTKLNLQIIMVSDERIDREDTTEASDRLFEVKIRKAISKVTQL
jgi:hypothetical protein